MTIASRTSRRGCGGRTGARPGRINFVVLAILVLLSGIFLVGAAGGYLIRTRTKARVALEQAYTDLDAGQWQQASRHFRQYLSKYPDDPEILARYAEVCLRIRPSTPAQVGNALGAYRRLFRLQLGEERTSRELIRLYRKVRDFNEMAYVCRQRLKVAPHDTEVKLLLAKALMAERHNEQAATLLQELLDETPGEPEVYILLSNIALEADSSDHLAMAKHWLDQGIVNNPDSPMLLARRARLLQVHLQDLDAAGEDLEAVWALAPTDPWVRMITFELWMMRGELDRAQADLDAVEGMGDTVFEAESEEATDLKLAYFEGRAALVLRRGDRAAGVALADLALAELNDYQWANFLPLAVDLYLADDAVEKARSAVAEYRDRLEAMQGVALSAQDHLAALEALVASADGDWYRVINLLEGVVARRPNNDTPWKLLAQAYEETGQSRRALYLWELYIERWPSDPIVSTLLVNAYINQQRWTDALMQARKAAPLMPADLEKTLFELRLAEIKARALSVAETGQAPEALDDALARLQGLRELHPDEIGIPLIRSFIDMYRGDTPGALQRLQELCRAKPDSVLAKLQLIAAYSRLGEGEEALDVAFRAAAENPEYAPSHTVLAQLLHRAGRTAEAIEVLERGREQVEGRAYRAVVTNLARLRLVRGDRAEGIALLEELAAAFPEDVRVRQRLLDLPEVQADETQVNRYIAEIKAIEGKAGLDWRLEQARAWLRSDTPFSHDEAIVELLQTCMEADPGWDEPVLALGSLYERMGEDELAEQVYRQFFRVHPESLPVANRLLELLQEQERYLQAWAVLRQLPRPLMRGSPYRARLALENQQYDEAIDALQMRVDADSRDATSRALLAHVLYQHRGEVQPALALLEQALELDPELPLAVSTRTSILLAEGRDDEVEALLDAYVKRRGDFYAYLMRAEVRERAGKLDQAEHDYQQLTQSADHAERGYELLGTFYLRQDRRDEALRAWETGLSVNPSNLSLQRRIMAVLLVADDPSQQQRGRELLEELMTLLPDDGDLLYRKAKLLTAEHRRAANDEAVDLLQRAVSLDPTHTHAWLLLVDLVVRRGDHDRARDLLSEAIGRNRYSADLVLAQTRLEMAADRPLLARSFGERVLELDPDNVPVRTLLVQLEIDAGEYEQAAKHAQEALAIAPDDEDVQLAWIRVLNVTGRRAEALDRLRAYMQTGSGAQSLQTMLAIAELSRFDQQFEAADQALKMAEKHAPDDPRVLFGRMKWLAAQGRYEDLLDRLDPWRGDRPDDVASLFSAASILAYADDARYVHRSKELFEELVRAQPDNIEAYLGLAQVAQQLDDFVTAEHAYRQVLAIAPYQREALNNLAYMLAVEFRSYDEALSLANKGVRRYPEYPYLLDTRGRIHMLLEDNEQARRDLEECLRYAQREPALVARASMNLARAYIALHEPRRAAVHLRHALRVDDEHHVWDDTQRAEAQKLLASVSS